MFTSIESGYGNSCYLRKLAPNIRGDELVVGSEFYFGMDDYHEVERLIKKPQFLAGFVRVHRLAMKRYKILIKRFSPLQVENNDSALKLFRLYIKNTRDYLYLDVGLLLDPILLKELLRYLDFSTASSLVAAKRPTDIGREFRGLSILTSRLKDHFGKSFVNLRPTQVLKRIAGLPLEIQFKKHLAKYSYLPTHTFKGRPWKLTNYLKRAQDLAREDRVISRLSTPVPLVPKSLPVSLRRMIRYIRQLNILRTESVELLNKWIWKLEPLWRYLAEKLNITREQLINLSYDEVERAIIKGKVTVSNIELKKRSVAYFWSWDGKGKPRYHSISPKIKKDVVRVSVLRGLSANQGRVIGMVRFVNGASNFYKFRKGEILVASHTTPNFVTIIHKAAAIITDMGGITSHAAIISRELGKPCIIGLGKATKVFKTGDLVEVDANNGIVRKLK